MIGALFAVALTSSIMIGAGVFTRRTAVRAAAGAIRRNGLMGIRTSATQHSDDAWIAAHTAGEHHTKLGGDAATATGCLAFVVAVVLAVVDPGGPEIPVLAGMSIVLAGAVVMTTLVVVGAIRGHRAAVDVRDGLGSDPVG